MREIAVCLGFRFFHRAFAAFRGDFLTPGGDQTFRARVTLQAA